MKAAILCWRDDCGSLDVLDNTGILLTKRLRGCCKVGVVVEGTI